MRIFDSKTDLFLGTTHGLFQLEKSHEILPGGFYSSKESIIKIIGYDSEIKSIFKVRKSVLFYCKGGHSVS